MKLVLDTGALLALERNDRPMWLRFKAAHLSGHLLAAHGGVLGQAWRGKGPRQALLAKALEGIDIRPIDETLGRATGELLAASGTSDVVDAALALMAEDGDHILTSDPDDMALLAGLTGRHVEIITV